MAGQPGSVEVGAIVVVLLLVLVLVVLPAWLVVRLKGRVQMDWPLLISPYLVLALALGIGWTGSPTGGALPDSFLGS